MYSVQLFSKLLLSTTNNKVLQTSYMGSMQNLVLVLWGAALDLLVYQYSHPHHWDMKHDLKNKILEANIPPLRAWDQPSRKPQKVGAETQLPYINVVEESDQDAFRTHSYIFATSIT